MVKALFLTDLHLNKLSSLELLIFFNKITELQPECLLITGDISNSKHLDKHLKLLSTLKIPIYFVLGNHCYYWSNFNQELVLEDNLTFLDQSCPIIIGKSAIIGHTGWYDLGYEQTKLPFVFLADWIAIENLRKIWSFACFIQYVQAKSIVSTRKLIEKLDYALDQEIDTIYCLTHFPPIKQDYGNKWSNKFWQPYNSNKNLWDQLCFKMKKHSNKKLIVLSGHSHHAEVVHYQNITVYVGDAAINEGQHYEFNII